MPHKNGLTIAMTLKDRLQSPNIIVAPGVYDALSASLAEQAGFDTVYLSGASLAYTKLGRPDIGLMSLTEINDTLAHVRERSEISVVVDCDTGFGNALNVMRSVRILERSGANAIQLEDQTYPKRCGHLQGKTLVRTGEMVGKIKAALDARHSDQTLIIGRTDAIASEGIGRALDRAQAYYEAGADMVFVEGIRSSEQIDQVMSQFKGKIPVMANMVEGGDTPLQDATTLEAMGFSMVIFPGALVRAFTYMASQFFTMLKADGTTNNFRDRMLDFKQLNDYLGTQSMLELGQQYEDGTR
ncbi:oxaloacetate decarboxylase [Marinobacter sp. M3C]|jgi:2-methylisocitrate lyase-like PEP mutase family enzyme|uniref:isocitrate lyase/PEP mutase family protein n=1 Tax=unclassified Marinobacter TaxID=83889 RepID=UPI002010BB9F|nr:MULTISPECIES: oxaloacetate decarboxylase [unclassified Marinobacter]MCL1479828.1 oxaloacetate decarboxylase [Marinobacter sp.]MCL1486431.1 oxaloacetate decarboxylase [Marinobacter sp.]UQG55993.1 oxaloacetate decarboxylase [Marinobacter sp. M4C]UQG58620.1 oxaloacetate decarboxylase [Marinobacter sp. M3C]UQG64798.1 oxaloacetate decarboxylase [Marinobacter sp. M2C]